MCDFYIQIRKIRIEHCFVSLKRYLLASGQKRNFLQLGSLNCEQKLWIKFDKNYDLTFFKV